MLKFSFMQTRTTSLLAIIIVLLMATACTAAATTIEPVASPTPVPTQAPAPTPTPLPTTQPEPAEPAESSSESPLEEAAKAEGGQLMIYTSMSTEDLDVVLAQFKESYPFVTVEYHRDLGEAVTEKLLTEAKAGSHLADVVENDTIRIENLLQNNILAPFIAPESLAYPDGAKDPDGYWTSDRINTVVVAYNTQLVKPADAPTTWEDLLDPKWKDKMVVEASDIELLIDMSSAWGDEKAAAFWEGIAAQNPTIMDGHTELAEALAAGEFAISPTVYAHRVEKLKAKGQPIEWVKTDPVFAFSQSVGLAAQAPHPATAKLFINWFLSEVGQSVVRDLGRIPGRAGISSDPPTLTEGINFYYSVPVSEEVYSKYAETWNSLLGLEK